MRVIAIGGRKGGVAKTTTALTLASMFTRDGKRVAVVDLDVQASASVALDVEPDTSGAAAALVDGTATAHVQFVHDGKLAVLTGGQDLADIQGGDLRATLRDLEVDVVLADCPPGHPHLDRLALRAADAVLVCIESTRMAVTGGTRVLHEVQRLAPQPPVALVVGKHDTRRTLDKLAPEMLRGAFPGVPLFTVRQDASLSTALSTGRLPRPGGHGWQDLETVFAWLGKALGEVWR